MAGEGTKLCSIKSGMKKAVSFEDFLKQLSDIRLNLEVDRYVLGTVSREKLIRRQVKEVGPKVRKSISGGTGSGVLFDLKSCKKKDLDRVRTEKNSAYG